MPLAAGQYALFKLQIQNRNVCLRPYERSHGRSSGAELQRTNRWVWREAVSIGVSSQQLCVRTPVNRCCYGAPRCVYGYCCLRRFYAVKHEGHHSPPCISFIAYNRVVFVVDGTFLLFPHSLLSVHTFASPSPAMNYNDYSHMPFSQAELFSSSGSNYYSYPCETDGDAIAEASGTSCRLQYHLNSLTSLLTSRQRG
jgi:hypothetical protein